MQHALAVYSAKPACSGKHLVEWGHAAGRSIRFLALGGLIPSDPTRYTKSLKLAGSGSALVVGASIADAEALARFDELFRLGDQKQIAAMLNGGELPWIELYTSAFQYEKHLKVFTRDKENLDGAVAAKDLFSLRKARTRYIVSNESRSKSGKSFMKSLTDLIAKSVDGIVADHQIPKR